MGEEIASRYLESKGFIVVSRNYWKPYGEIDLVASKEGTTHFLEVKSVSREIVGTRYTGNGRVPRVTADWNPAERVDTRKMKRLERVIQAYLLERNVSEDWQIDVVLVYIDEKRKKAKVEMLESVQ